MKMKATDPTVPDLNSPLYYVDPRKPHVSKGLQERGPADSVPFLLFSLSLLVEVGAQEAQ